MRPITLIALLLVCAAPTLAQTPTLVQHVSGPTAGAGIDNYKLQLPNASLSGNCLIVSVTTNTGGGTITITDDKSNTYTAGPTVTGNQVVSLFYTLNSTAGVKTITATFSVTITFVQVVASEFRNVATSAASDGSSTGSSTATAVATGAITTAVNGDLIYQVGWSDTGTNITGWTQGTSPFKLLSADLTGSIGGAAAQYQVQATAGSITPSMTQSSSLHFDTVAIALKSASSGTAPATGIRIVSVQHTTILLSATSPIALQFPTTGNLIAVSWLSIQPLTLTAVSDGNSNTYSFAGANFSPGTSGTHRIAYAVNPTTSTTMTGPTLTFSGTNASGDTVILYNITGADTVAPFDSTAGNPTASGTDSTTGTHTVSTVSITPTTANGLIIVQMGVDLKTVTTVDRGNFISCVSSPEATSADMDENNGWAAEYNTDTAARTYTFTITGGAANSWGAMAAAFKAPAAGASIACNFISLLGVGCR